MDITASSSKSVYFLSNRIYRLLYLIIFLLLWNTTHSGDYFLCQPNKPSSCNFGGQCTPMDTVQSLRRSGRFNGEQHICKCEAFACSRVGLDPVCGNDNVTYVNDVCRRAKECTSQTRIDPVCKGRCGSPDCKPIRETARRCPPEKSTLCVNFGECLLADITNVPYCKCISGFEGSRCEKGSINVQGVKTEENPNNREDSAFKVAFLVVVGILSLIAILHIVYCFIRCRESSDDNMFAEDGKKGVGGGLVTPVRNPIEKRRGQEGNANCISTIEEQDG